MITTVVTEEEILGFSRAIEKLSNNENINYIDAICHYCEETGLEVELASALLSPSLRDRIREQAENLNLIRKESQLPI